MTASSRDSSGDKVRKLLERHHPREAFRILAANILSPDRSVQEQHAPSNVETGSRKITISKGASQRSRNWDTEYVGVPANDDEARRLVQGWRNGKPVMTGDVVGIILYLDKTGRPEVANVWFATFRGGS